MMLDDEYDQSLWLLLKVNNNNSKTLDFIKEYPEELIKKIQITLRKYKNCNLASLDIDDVELSDFNGSMILNDNLSYWYCIDIVNGVLDIGRTFDMGFDQYDIFELTLAKFNKNYYEDLKIGKGMYIGSTMCSFVDDDYEENIVDVSFCNYDLIKLPFSKMIVKENNSYNRKNRYSMVHCENIPCELNKKYFNMVDSSKKLVRYKKNKVSGK